MFGGISAAVARSTMERAPAKTTAGVVAYLLMALVFLHHCSAGSSSSTQPRYLLEFSRLRGMSADINFLSLECTDTITGNRVSNALFFLDNNLFFDLTEPDLAVPERLPARPVSLNNKVLFTICREAEGNYSCGVRLDTLNFLKSPPLKIVGKYMCVHVCY